MKLWELRAICQSGDALEAMRDRPEWVRYVRWNELMDMTARSRQASTREAEQRRLYGADLPDALVRHVLAATPRRFYESGGRISSTRAADADVEVTALEVFERHGGPVLVEVDAHGAVDLGDPAHRGRRPGGAGRASLWRRLRGGR